MNNLLEDLLSNIASYYDQLVETLPKILVAFFVFLFFYFISKRSRKFVNSRLVKKMDDPLLATFLSRVIQIFIIIIGCLIALQILGLAGLATGLITGASVSAIVIGFAFKDIGENFLAGIMLAFHRPFRVGDTVELDGFKGQVVALNLRNSQIKTFDGKDIFIPNADVVKNPVVNYTMDGFLRYDFTIGLDYNADLNEAIQIILTTMRTIQGILQKDKKTFISVSNLGPNSIDITVYYWLNTFDLTISPINIKTQAINQTLAALEKAGIYLPGNVMELKNFKGEDLKTSS